MAIGKTYPAEVASSRSGARSGTPRITVYLATEARHVHPPGTVPAASADRVTFATAGEVMQCLRTHDLSRHPLAQRLRREGGAAALPAIAAEIEALLAFGDSDDPEEASAQRWARRLARRQLGSLPGESESTGLGRRRTCRCTRSSAAR